MAQSIQPIKNIPFEVIVKALYAREVTKFDQNKESNKAILKKISSAMRNVCKTVQKNPIERQRANEVGNDMEPFVIDELKKNGLNAERPKTKSGKGKSTGYPDIVIHHGDTTIYLEVKTFAAKNRNTTQRTFYLSPSDDPKVTENACHLAVGFEIDRAGNLFTPQAYEIIDLYGLDCDMKLEFNSDNKRLYQNHHILKQERV